MRSLAHELAPYGVTANAISPGMIDTVRGASAGKIPASIAATGGVLGRKGKPEEIAAIVRALLRAGGSLRYRPDHQRQRWYVLQLTVIDAFVKSGLGKALSHSLFLQLS